MRSCSTSASRSYDYERPPQTPERRQVDQRCPAGRLCPPRSRIAKGRSGRAGVSRRLCVGRMVAQFQKLFALGRASQGERGRLKIRCEGTMSFLSALRNGVSEAWLRLVKSLNVIAASLFGGIVLLNAAYPQAVTDL